MTSSLAGVQKVAAGRIGVTVFEYERRVSLGEKWCTRCCAWHPRSAFGVDRMRGDGRDARCLASRRVKVRKTRKKTGPRGWREPARSGDKLQARRRVNYLVEQGRIPRPSELPCTDCGDTGQSGARHEYDHHMGYAAEHHLDVEAVCAPCHHAREANRSG